MKAIVYTSQTGHTQRYAQMLAERTGVPAYSLKEAGKSLRRGEEIFYMGWLMAGTVKGLQSNPLQQHLVAGLSRHVVHLSVVMVHLMRAAAGIDLKIPGGGTGPCLRGGMRI